MGRWIGLAAVVAVIALSAASARAQGDPVGDAADAQAHDLFEAAREAFREGRNEDALADFRRSYELSHRAELLYNIGQTCDRLRRDQEALDAFTAYLRAIPTAANREEVEARLAVLRQVLRDEALATLEPRVAAAGSVEADDAVTEDAGPPERVERQVVDEWWFWTAIVGGAVLIATGVTIGVVVATQPRPEPLLDGQVGGVIFALEVRP